MSNENMAENIGSVLEETLGDVTKTVKGIEGFEGESFSTGLENLDAVLGGLVPGELACIAGTSRAGRHTLACQIAFSVAKQGSPVLLVTLETSRRQVALRALSAEARVGLSDLSAGELGEDELKRIVDASEAISGYDLHLCCGRDIGAGDVTELVEESLGGRGGGLVVLCGVERLGENCGHDADWAAARMKNLAVEMGLPVVITVGVHEGIARCVRKGGYDLCDVGIALDSVADECDVLTLLDRSSTPEEGARADAPDFGTAVVAVARNAHGSCGLVRLAYAPEYGRFLDLVDDEAVRA